MSNISSPIDNYISSVFGSEALENYYTYINQKPIDYIRVSNQVNYDIYERLKEYNISLEPTSFDRVFAVKDDTNNFLGKTIEFVIGDYYIQSLSSVLPPIVLEPQLNESVVDLCAAPGSKTTQISQLMNNTGFLVANEPDIKRVKTLAHNLDKYTSVNSSIMINKGELLSKYFDAEFDKVLADVPCTGLGILHKKNEITNWWSKKIVDAILDIQYKILLSGIRLAKVGGTIVYSTCTLTIEENEYIIDKILKNYPVEIIDYELNLQHHKPLLKYQDKIFDERISNAKRVFPWEINSEGFFICKMRKIDELEKKEKFSYKIEKKDYFYFDNSKDAEYIKALADQYGIDKTFFENKLFLKRGNDIYMTNVEFPTKYLSIFNRVGLKIATINKNNQIIPHTYLSLLLGDRIKNNLVDLDNEQVKSYINGGNFYLDTTDGYKIVRYKGNNIGVVLVKNKVGKSQFPKSKRSQEIVIR